MRILKNDQVVVIAGKDKGKKGKVMKVFPTESRVLVEKINYRTVFLRRSQENPNGGVTKVEGKIHISNLQLLDPRDGKPTRVGYTILADGEKSRVSKKTKEHQLFYLRVSPQSADVKGDGDGNVPIRGLAGLVS